MPAPKSPTVLLSCVLGLFVTIAIVAFGSLSNADAKLDGEKLDKEVYNQHIVTEKERRVRQDAQWEKIDEKLDKALGL